MESRPWDEVYPSFFTAEAATVQLTRAMSLLSCRRNRLWDHPRQARHIARGTPRLPRQSRVPEKCNSFNSALASGKSFLLNHCFIGPSGY